MTTYHDTARGTSVRLDGPELVFDGPSGEQRIRYDQPSTMTLVSVPGMIGGHLLDAISGKRFAFVSLSDEDYLMVHGDQNTGEVQLALHGALCDEEHRCDDSTVTLGPDDVAALRTELEESPA